MKKYLSLIKFSHTIFALPFAIVGFVLAHLELSEAFPWKQLVLIILCMIFARSAAMAFNRLVDSDIDLLNPRTANREIPSGKVSKLSASLFVLINVVLFIGTTFFINKICFFLSPIALLIILGYSLSKRFTWMAHIILGLGLSLAPIGAYLAVAGQFHIYPILFSLIVLFWVAGFDIIYALQDEDFDANNKLYSIPSYFGPKRALMLSLVMHILSVGILGYATYDILAVHDEIHVITIVAACIFSGLMLYQHTLVKPDDLSKVNIAFFTTNGIASLLFGALFLIDGLLL